MPEEILLDVHGLEPPEPFERATAVLLGMQPGRYLKLLIPRRPRMLYPWLAQHGFREFTREVAEHQFEVYAWHAGDHASGAALAGLVRD